MSQCPQLPPEVKAKRSSVGWNLFVESCRLVLSRWDLLRTAVVEEWGGRSSKSKFEHILSDLLKNCQEQWREGHDLHEDTLDVYFLECLTADFNIDFEDESGVTGLSLVLQALYRKCAGGESDAVASLVKALDARPDFNPDPAARARARAGSDSEDDGSSGDECGDGGGGGGGAGGGEGGPGRRARVVDEEGWETVPGPGGAGGGGKGGKGGHKAGGEGAGPTDMDEA